MEYQTILKQEERSKLREMDRVAGIIMREAGIDYDGMVYDENNVLQRDSPINAIHRFAKQGFFNDGHINQLQQVGFEV